MTLEDLAAEWRDAEREVDRARRRLQTAVWLEVQRGGTTRPIGRRIGVTGECVRLWVRELEREQAEGAQVDLEQVAGQLALVEV